MKIKGIIGNVKKSEVLSVLTRDGKDAVQEGEITLEEAGQMYKLEMVKRNSVIGKNGETFMVNYERIPEELRDKLSPEELGSLTDAFYRCYSEGRCEK